MSVTLIRRKGKATVQNLGETYQTLSMPSAAIFLYQNVLMSDLSSEALSAGSNPGNGANSAATNQLSGEAGRRRRFSASQLWLFGINALVLSLLLFFVVRLLGHVSGEEFSPTHFRTREFSFYEIPVLHWQITPVLQTPNTPNAATYLTQKKWVTPPGSPPKTWHLVKIQRGFSEEQPSDAALLVRQLRASQSGLPVWEQWSTDHPKLAPVLWPTVAKLAERELYILMPRLFEIIRDIDDLPTLKTTLQDYLRDEYTSLVQDMRAANRDELADALLSEVNQDYPSDEALRRLQNSDQAHLPKQARSPKQDPSSDQAIPPEPGKRPTSDQP